MRGEVPFWAKEQLALRRTFETWVSDEIDKYQAEGFEKLFGQKAGHGLDEAGGYTRSFVGAYCLSGDPRLPAFMKQFRDDWHAAITAAGHFHRGYARNTAGDYITHTAEAFTQFLLNVLYLDITDAATVEIIDEAAGCLGNWHDDVQDFYDWHRHIFLSYFLGTQSPYHAPPYNFQSPRHFRVLQIAVAAYEATGNGRYLKLCEDYCDFYAPGILEAADDMDAPTAYYMISPEQFERYCRDKQFTESRRFRYYERYADAVADLPDGEPALRDGRPCIPYARIRDTAPPCSGLHDPVMTWLEILKHLPKDPYKRVLRRLVAGWVGLGRDSASQVAGTEPHCGLHLPKYRNFTGDTSLDGAYLAQWPDGPSAYLLTGEEKRLLGAASAAEALFAQTVARNAGRFGKQFICEHACNVLSNAGASSAYVAPALFMPAFGGLNVHYGRAAWVNVLYYTDGRIGLPADVAALYVPAIDADARPAVKLANAGHAPQTIAVRRLEPVKSGELVLTAPGPAGLA
ncbi:MAG: hypothetical protein ACYTF6_09775, partial [Planctomycetota bacterium]